LPRRPLALLGNHLRPGGRGHPKHPGDPGGQREDHSSGFHLAPPDRIDPSSLSPCGSLRVQTPAEPTRVSRRRPETDCSARHVGCTERLEGGDTTRRWHMPEKKTIERATKAKREGKSASTQAGEFVREEIHHVREGKHGARSAKQAIAIGLSKARRAGVKLPAPARGTAPAETRHRAEKDIEAGRHRKKSVAPTRSRATRRVLEQEGHAAAS